MANSKLQTYLDANPTKGPVEGAVEVLIAELPAAGGTATATKQDTGNTSLAAIDTNLAKTIPATTATAVTPSDSTALTSRSVWVGGAGNLSVRLSGATGTTVVFTNVPDGSLLPLSVVRVMAATTATDVVVLN